MALIKCKDCEKEFSTDAKKCPHCGAKKVRKASLIEKVGFVVLGSALIWSILSEPNNPSFPTYNSTVTASAPRLELERYSCGRTYGYYEIQGRVKNISDKPIDNLLAVGEFYDESENFIKADDTLVEYRPLLPGQTSPFKVLTSGNPAIKKCSVSFKEFGGREIEYQEKAKEEKNKPKKK